MRGRLLSLLSLARPPLSRSVPKRARAPRVAFAVALAAVVVLAIAQAGGVGAAENPRLAGNWTVNKFPQGQPACTGVGFAGLYFDKLDCAFGWVDVSGTSSPADNGRVFVDFVDETGRVLGTSTTSFRAAEASWQFSLAPGLNWPSGVIKLRARVGSEYAVGDGEIYMQQLGASIAAETREQGYRPGEAIPLSGTLYEQDNVGPNVAKTNVPGTYSLRVITSSGEVRGPYGPFTANRGGDGVIQETLPAEATQGLTATQATGYETTVRVEVIDAAYNDLVTGAWTAKRTSAGHVTLSVPPGKLVLENSYVSAVGWVKPGATYPFRIFIRNYDFVQRTSAVVRIPAVDGMTFVRATPATGSGTASISNGTITWNAGSVPARTAVGPGLRTLVVEAKADSLADDPQIVWKDLSTTATLTYRNGPTVTDTSHGPKVIPPKSTFDTARYGFRPFPVVPVDYRDRKHEASHSAERLLNVINSPDLPGSTYRLYQEMSYGQLHPNGAVPSAARASADFNVTWSSPHRRASGFAFSQPAPRGACYGASVGPLSGTPVYNERIADGWYQLPGDTAYYGGDLISVANVGTANPSFIDNACGPIAKAVYDSALIADPEIDYSDYDTDKDGVVDFYMMVFAGLGGNGASQLSVPPYDNIWPHSSSLENYYKDPETGLLGYVSDDQLKDHQGRPLYYTNASRGAMTTTPTDYPVYVRVGPYNVNPEAAIEKASVISHEYGHSLGLPDYYSSGSARRTYGDWNLMATDKSQHMDVNAKQELGWVVPRVLKPGETAVTGWRDSKVNTHRIDWVQPDGTPYTLTGPRVSNGEAYVARLPGRQIIAPEKVANGASPTHVWWSRSGNDFGCPPTAGHNLDIDLPELATVPAGTPVTLTFKSNWDIEWDFDYGFVLTKYIDVDPQGNARDTDYVSHASQKNFSTPAQFNPNSNGCQDKYGNGLTGTTASFANGTFAVDRNPAENLYPQEDLQGNPVGFVEDSYDISRLAGKAGAVLRFTYSTDPGLARPGWFIDDIRITAGDQVIYESNFENGADETRIYNGGCKENLQVAQQCTAGWQYVSSTSKAEQDHAYYLEMRDRSGFDYFSKDQNDRAPLAFLPGLLLVYTDEAAGYGNTGELADDSPNQSPLDSEPQIGSQTPNLNDAAFTAVTGKNRFSDSVNAAQPEGWVDNYKDAHDPESTEKYADTNWHFDFNCLTFQVLGMSGDGLGPDDIGPDGANTDLRGDVSFTLGSGCAAYDYGVGPETNAKPTAVIQVKPSRGSVRVNQRVRFDGSASYDDRDPSPRLAYEWDFQGDGTVDATTREATHRYPTVGTYSATLKVTDTGGLSDTETVLITVTSDDDDD